MPFKGTDKVAYRKAAKGKTKQERSEIYYKEKRKNEKSANRKTEIKSSKFSKTQLSKSIFDFHNESTKTYGMHNNTKFGKIDKPKKILANHEHKKNITKEIVEEKQISSYSVDIKKHNKIFFKKVKNQFGDKLKEQIVDITLNIIKQEIDSEILNTIQTCQNIKNYIAIAQDIYKIVIKIDNFLDKIHVKYKKTKENVGTSRSNNTSTKTNTYILEEWHFDGDRETSNKLFNLVNNGVKVAISNLYDGMPLGENKCSILTNWDKTKKILIKDTHKYILKYGDITDEFAYKEGEDDKSLNSWKRIHEDYFAKELETKGSTLSDETNILCKEFIKIRKII